jgi:hypothetical protein
MKQHPLNNTSCEKLEYCEQFVGDANISTNAIVIIVLFIAIYLQTHIFYL